MAAMTTPKTRIAGLAGNDESTSVLGDPKDAQKIATATLDVVKRFTDAIIKQDIETAYGVCATELRTGLDLKRFVGELDKADSQYNGKPLAFSFECITWIYCDEASREGSNKDGDWPKETPKPNKRAVGFGWFTDQKNDEGEFGRNIAFWITEETGGYRIAKFKQYHQ